MKAVSGHILLLRIFWKDLERNEDKKEGNKIDGSGWPHGEPQVRFARENLLFLSFFFFFFFASHRIIIYNLKNGHRGRSEIGGVGLRREGDGEGEALGKEIATCERELV